MCLNIDNNVFFYKYSPFLYFFPYLFECSYFYYLHVSGIRASVNLYQRSCPIVNRIHLQ
jgi:hypothetical protein